MLEISERAEKVFGKEVLHPELWKGRIAEADLKLLRQAMGSMAQCYSTAVSYMQSNDGDEPFEFWSQKYPTLISRWPEPNTMRRCTTSRAATPQCSDIYEVCCIPATMSVLPWHVSSHNSLREWNTGERITLSPSPADFKFGVIPVTSLTIVSWRQQNRTYHYNGPLISVQALWQPMPPFIGA